MWLVNVPTIGDLFHITKTAISVGDEISPIFRLGDVKHNGTGDTPNP